MDKSGLSNIINPLTPYLISDFYMSDEIMDNNVWKDKFDKSLIKGINLLEIYDYSIVKDYDVIQCQINLLSYFYYDILPHLEDKKIILLTTQYKSPCLIESSITEEILKNPSIFLWASHNHIYKNGKCINFPYGIDLDKVNFYYRFMNNNKIRKKIEISRLKLTIQDNLPEGHVRIEYPILGIESGQYLYYYDYLKTILESKYALSPEGENPDCSRHYECIGLGCVPICNVDMRKMFGDNILYSTPEEMTKFIEFGEVFQKWKKPNKNIIFRNYWELRLRDKINKME